MFSKQKSQEVIKINRIQSVGTMFIHVQPFVSNTLGEILTLKRDKMSGGRVTD